MDWNLYRQFLLTNIPTARTASGGTFVTCKCMECGDSLKSKNTHMYISIPQNDDDVSWYYCHKCNCYGWVTHNTLIKWGLFDKDIALGLSEHITKIRLSGKGDRLFRPSVYQIMHSYVTPNAKTEEKRQYVCNRIGRDLSVADLCNLKICLNLIDLLEENNIRYLTRDKNIVKQLDREFVGFISIDNAFLNMRRTCDEGIVNENIDKRYINYRIFDKEDTAQRFYTIPSQVDLNSRNRIKLHIAEGPFDILSVYLNLRNCEPGIYTSVSGNNYYNILMHFLSTMKLPYIEVNAYCDNDKYGGIDRIRSIMDKIPDKTIPVYIHKNTYPGEKDFGVPLNRINESVLRLR